jgi:transposase-like protein
MRILDYITRFSNEESCKDYFYRIRLKQGVICKRCNSEKHYWLSNRAQFECSKCKFRTTLRSGTVMENSRLSFQTWFLIFFLMTNTKKGLSAREMQRQIGHKRYTTIWAIMHRIREKMGKRDEKYILKDMIEFDEAYIEKAVPESIKSNLKRGKGSPRQANVVVIAESIPLEDKKGKKSRFCGYFKMKVIPNGKAETIDQILKQSIEEKTIVFTDKSTSYVNISDYVEVHITEKSSPQTTKETLQWVHIAISNAKRTLLGIYHKINGKYLQNYLDEFIYKLNRRYFYSLFDRLLIAVV